MQRRRVGSQRGREPWQVVTVARVVAALDVDGVAVDGYCPTELLCVEQE